MRAILILLIALAAILPDPARAKTPSEVFADLGRYNADGRAFLEGLTYYQGGVTIEDEGIRVELPDSYYFIGRDDAFRVMVDALALPLTDARDIRGMVLPTKYTPLDPDAWWVTVGYEPDGYVPDDDASSLRFDGLLATMRSDLEETNEGRAKNGFPPIRLVGWAVPPSYDKAAHRLTWAREVQFGTKPDTTINYAIRTLGRRGLLTLNIVSTKKQLPEVRAALPDLLRGIAFIPGARYGDFQPETDTLAPYKITGLITNDQGQNRSLGRKLYDFANRFFLLAVIGLGLAVVAVNWVSRQRRAER